MEGGLTWGGEHTVQCTDDVLWNRAPEAYIIGLTNVTRTNSIKKKQKKCTILLDAELISTHRLILYILQF